MNEKHDLVSAVRSTEQTKEKIEIDDDSRGQLAKEIASWSIIASGVTLRLKSIGGVLRGKDLDTGKLDWFFSDLPGAPTATGEVEFTNFAGKRQYFLIDKAATTAPDRKAHCLLLFSSLMGREEANIIIQITNA